MEKIWSIFKKEKEEEKKKSSVWDVFEVTDKATTTMPTEPTELTQFGIGAKSEDKPMEDFSTPMGKIQYYKSKIDWLENIAKKKDGFEWGGAYDAYRYAVEQYNKAIKEYNIKATSKWKQTFKEHQLEPNIPEPKKPEVPSSQYGISELNKPEQMGKIQKGIIGAFGTWEAKKKANPELQKMEDFSNQVLSEANKWAEELKGTDWKKSGSSIEEVAIIYEHITGKPKEEALTDIKSQKDLNIFFLNPPKKYEEAVKLQQYLSDIHMRIAEPSKDLIGQLGWAGMVAIMGTQAVNAIYKAGMVIEDRVIKGEKLQQAVKRIQKAYISETGKFKSSLSQNDFRIAQSLNQTLKKYGKDIFPLQSMEVPQEVFMGQAGKITNLVKIIQKGITPEVMTQIKALSNIEVSQVTQQLLNVNPALASEFLKAVEKPEKPEIKDIFKESISESKSITEKQSLKKRTVEGIKSGELTGAVRFGSAAELEKTLKDKKLPVSKEYDEIHAQPIMGKDDDYFAVYGPYDKHTIGIVIPEEYTQVKPDAHTKEVIVNPDVPIEKLKFIIKNDVYTYEEIMGTKEYAMPEKIVAVGEEVGGTGEIKPEAKSKKIMQDLAEKVEIKPEEPKIDLATPKQIKKAHAIANSKAMISKKGKVKPQYRAVAKGITGKTSIKDMIPEEAEMFIDALERLPEPKYRAGKLVAPSIPRTMKLTTEGFFQKKYGEPTPVWLLTDQTYYATKLGIHPLVEPFEKGKQEFDLEFRQSSHLVDKMVNKLNMVAKTSAFAKIKSKVKNVPTKAESKMAELINKHEATPSGLTEKEEDIFKYFRNLSKDIWRRENEVREKVDLPPIKYKQAYFRHTADAMAKEMLEGKYPFPQGIKYWGEKMVGKKIFNPMEFHRKLSDDLIDLWSKDIRAVTKAMLWSGLKEIYLAQPAKFLNEQLNAISKDLPEYKDLSPRDQATYDQTRVMPSSTKKWLVDYVNQVLKGQETELDASLNRIVTKSGLKGIFDKVLSPFGRAVGRKPITNIFMLSGRAVISGVMGWVPRQIMRNSFQPVQNLALYGVKAMIKSYLPASVDKNLKELMSESLFLKSYTGFEELPTNLMAKLEKVWLGPYGIVAVNNAKLGMKAAYWNTVELIKNPKFKKHGWADPQRTKDTPKGFLHPSEKEKLLREMEFGASATQYQYIPIGMPGVFRYKALVPLTRLQSWWMNYFSKFTGEALYRGFKGRPSWAGEDGPTLPWSRRVNYLKYVIIGGAILTALGYKKSFMLGVAPTYLSPAGQVALGMYNYVTATEDWKREKALKQIYYSWKAFIPGSLAWRDFLAVWEGEKDLKEILFYGEKEERKAIPKSDVWEEVEGKKEKSDVWGTFDTESKKGKSNVWDKF